MKVQLTDQLHLSSVSANTLARGTVVDVSEAEAKSLVDRGLATKIAAAPKNKMDKAPANKAGAARRRK